MKSTIDGKCALCGEFKQLSFEHVPPKSAFNDKPILVQGSEQLTDQTSKLFGKKSKSNKGFGGYTLCNSCNNNTGAWYAKDFADFAHQGMKIIQEIKNHNYVIEGNYIIKPLNVIKQIFTMFMSADKSGHLQSIPHLVEFIMDKEKIGMPDGYKIFLYSSLSPVKRKIGYSIVYAGELGIQKWSEINFQPFGYLLAEDSLAAHKDMCDISEFGKFSYDELVSVKITSRYLIVSSPWIGEYD